jgi:outer membrane biosynthesis protein TonB
VSSSVYSRPGPRPVFLSTGLHALLVVGLWMGQELGTEPVEYVTYQMELITEAELADMSSAPDEPEVETPNAPLPEPEPEPEPEPIPEPEPEPEPELEPAPPEPEPEPEPAPPEPEPEIVEQPTQPAENLDISRASTEQMAVVMQGLRQDYPQYYEDIVRQINRCFRWTGGGQRWTTIVRFEIQRDGTIPGSSIQLYQRSGNGTFDIQAFGAVECAGAGRLSPLPEDLPYDALPVQFTFSPA